MAVVPLFVFGAWRDVVMPTLYERASFHRATGATLSPETVGLTSARFAEIAAWIEQIDRRLSENDRRFLRLLGITWDAPES